MPNIQDIIYAISQVDFQRIDLKQAESAQLMNRVDSKYFLPAGKVLALINSCCQNYFAVEINNQVVHGYHTEYFDTPNLDMYLDHHNQRPYRYKLRIRTYNVSGDQFFEIKHRTPDGKTRKRRVEYVDGKGLDDGIKAFVESKSPYLLNNLSKTIITDFYRVTLVSKSLTERVTIDLGLDVFATTNNKTNLDFLSIVEIKQDKSRRGSQIAENLKRMGVRPSGFSKYSVGQAILNQNIKKNNFKRVLIKINNLRYE